MSRSAEITRVEELIPAHLRGEANKLVELLEDYYLFLNDDNNPSAAINSLVQEHDLYRCSEPYLESIHDLIASYIPNPASISKRDLMKKIVRYFYNNRGSRQSAETFFRIFFNTFCIISDPVKDHIISDCGSIPIDSENIKAWKPYSYNIKTDISIEEWETPYRDLIHPVGFRFFVTLLLAPVFLNYWTDQHISANALDYYKPINIWFVEMIRGLDLRMQAPGHTPFSQPGWLPIPPRRIYITTPYGYNGRTHLDYDLLLKFIEPNVFTDDFRDYITQNAITAPRGHTYNLAQFANVGSYIRSVSIYMEEDNEEPISEEDGEALSLE